MTESTFGFRAFPTLETPRLRLREMVPSDADALFTLRGDYEVTHYNIGAAYPDITHAHSLIDAMTRLYHEEKELRWGITLPDEGDTVIGMIGFNSWHRIDRRGSIGFDLARAFWRRGIMREAVEAVLQFGFLQMGLNRIEADASAENVASIALLTSRGFRHEGTQRDHYWEDDTFHDLLLFGLLHRDWENH